ncbi:hypothetical protein PSTG_13476 [Puccinia striiformis f. sp. tritici PST-78]|uniref:Uncharacterized protein n=1 Tax=Puccinia striiformis f. sp. tritici PST-78 TaxID=1165861 RepID=A0A0L0V1L8_9BASI|nr:hypothetical protein PSTG_13476 [Puccinia striiformis f. sp. tritici PST-78]
MGGLLKSCLDLSFAFFQQFANSSNSHLCSFCCVTKEKIDVVNLDSIRPKNAGVLRKKATEWKNAGTLSERKAIFKSFSVHYSVLYELPYFDTLLSAVVEPMRNIFLGHLHHHGQDIFGLKMPTQNKLNDEIKPGSLRPEELQLNSKGKQKVVQSKSVEALLAPFQNLEIPLAVESEHVPDTANPEESKGKSEDDGDSEDEECSYALDCQIPTDSNPLGARFFGKGENLQILPEVNKEFQLPSWIGRVPSTVGAAKGGKLKADEWVILFEIIMIPTLIQIPFKSHYVFQVPMFENLLHLCSIVNIVQSLKIDHDDIEALQLHLKAHREGLLDIFPTFPTKPDHHLALHLPDCLCQFSPAPQWTAWSFQRPNGSLASIPTNNHIETQDLTLLRRWVTAQNYRNLLPSLCQHLRKDLSQPLLEFIKPSKSVGQFFQAMNMDQMDLSKLNYNPQKLETLDFESHEPLVHSFKHKFSVKAKLSTSIYTSWTKNETAVLNPRLVHQQKSITFGNVTYTTFDQHTGNSTILYYTDLNGTRQDVCGQISQIFTMSYSAKRATWQLPHACFGISRTALCVVDLSKNVSTDS